ncbi:MAG: hypothetical protein H6716_24765 [Polyangiaceae bacterium]|nr:hypothetical protein [Polyangiaceae bacterium]
MTTPRTATPTILPTSTREGILESIVELVEAGHRVRLGRWSLIKDSDYGYDAFDLGFIDDTPENRAGAPVDEDAWWAEHDFEDIREAAEALLKAWNSDW